MSSGAEHAAAWHLAPSSAGDDKVQAITGTAATEAHNTRPLPAGRFATLKIGKARVRVIFRGDLGAATVVDATSITMEPGERYDWMVNKNTCVVYLEAEDGAAAYQAWVWPSSPKVT